MQVENEYGTKKVFLAKAAPFLGLTPKNSAEPQPVPKKAAPAALAKAPPAALAKAKKAAPDALAKAPPAALAKAKVPPPALGRPVDVDPPAIRLGASAKCGGVALRGSAAHVIGPAATLAVPPRAVAAAAPVPVAAPVAVARAPADHGAGAAGVKLGKDDPRHFPIGSRVNIRYPEHVFHNKYGTVETHEWEMVNVRFDCGGLASFENQQLATITAAACPPPVSPAPGAQGKPPPGTLPRCEAPDCVFEVADEASSVCCSRCSAIVLGASSELKGHSRDCKRRPAHKFAEIADSVRGPVAAKRSGDGCAPSNSDASSAAASAAAPALVSADHGASSAAASAAATTVAAEPSEAPLAAAGSADNVRTEPTFVAPAKKEAKSICFCFFLMHDGDLRPFRSCLENLHLDGRSKCAVIAFSGKAEQASVVQACFNDFVDDFRVKLHWVGPGNLTSNATLLSNTALRVGADLGFDLLSYCEWAGTSSTPGDVLAQFARHELLANTSNVAFASDYWVVLWSWAWRRLGFFEETFAPPRNILSTMLLYAEQYELQLVEYCEVALLGSTLIAL